MRLRAAGHVVEVARRPTAAERRERPEAVARAGRAGRGPAVDVLPPAPGQAPAQYARRVSERGFASDNYAGALPEVIDAIVAANQAHATSYGADDWTSRAQERFREQFGPDARAYLVFNGTGANV